MARRRLATDGTPLGIAIYKYKADKQPQQPRRRKPLASLLQVTVVPGQGRRLPVSSAGCGVGAGRDMAVSAENNQTERNRLLFLDRQPARHSGLPRGHAAECRGTDRSACRRSRKAGDFSIGNQNANSGVGPFEAASNQGLPGEIGRQHQNGRPDDAGPEQGRRRVLEAPPLTGSPDERQYASAHRPGAVCMLPLPAAGTMPTINPHFTQPDRYHRAELPEPAILLPGHDQPRLCQPRHQRLDRRRHRCDNRSYAAVSAHHEPGASCQASPRFARFPSTRRATCSSERGRASLMNDDADAVGTAVAASTNARNYPTVMDPFGRINPLPWETVPAEAKPWNAAAPVNNSPDYPDVLTRSNSGNRPADRDRQRRPHGDAGNPHVYRLAAAIVDSDEHGADQRDQLDDLGARGHAADRHEQRLSRACTARR